MKKYENGELTPRLLAENFNGEIVLSQPMGAGMKFDQIPSKGKVIIVCGGTGILPFCDFIDLLFKRTKFLESPSSVKLFVQERSFGCQRLHQRKRIRTLLCRRECTGTSCTDPLSNQFTLSVAENIEFFFNDEN
jgi:hypothetical protein